MCVCVCVRACVCVFFIYVSACARACVCVCEREWKNKNKLKVETNITLASNLGYLATPPPQDNFPWVPNCHWMGNEGVLRKKLVWTM